MRTLVKSLQNPPESPWFDWIKDGTKNYEGRLLKDDWATLKTDDLIIFVCPEKRELTVRVINQFHFKSFGEAYDALGSQLIPIPGVCTEDVIKIYGKYFKDEDILKYGVVAVQVEPLKK